MKSLNCFKLWLSDLFVITQKMFFLINKLNKTNSPHGNLNVFVQYTLMFKSLYNLFMFLKEVSYVN